MCRGQRPRMESWGAAPQEGVAGTGEGTAFPPPLQAIRAAGTHMFWCMRQPSAPTQPPPHRLRHTDTLPSRPPARLPAQAHSDTAASTPAGWGPGSLSGRGQSPGMQHQHPFASARAHMHIHTHAYICMRAHTHWLQLGFKYEFTSQCRESKMILGRASGLSLSFSHLYLYISISPSLSPFLCVSLVSVSSISFSFSPQPCLCVGLLATVHPLLCACCPCHVLLGASLWHGRKPPIPGQPGAAP